MASNFYSTKDRSAVKVLELGCGGGACTWYLAREGFDTYAVDGSTCALERAREYLDLEGVSARLVEADFLDIPFEAEFFDAAVDVASIQQNTMEHVRSIVKRVWELLLPGGRLFSMMVAKGTWGDGLGKEVELNTFTEIPGGPYQELGTTHFFDESELNEVFSPFSQVEVERSTRTADGRRHEIKHWVITATK